MRATFGIAAAPIEQRYESSANPHTYRSKTHCLMWKLPGGGGPNLVCRQYILVIQRHTMKHRGRERMGTFDQGGVNRSFLVQGKFSKLSYCVWQCGTYVAKAMAFANYDRVSPTVIAMDTEVGAALSITSYDFYRTSRPNPSCQPHRWILSSLLVPPPMAFERCMRRLSRRRT